jgi:hypothetical protein
LTYMTDTKYNTDMETELTDIVKSLEYAYENLMKATVNDDHITDATADVRFALKTAQHLLEEMYETS